MCLYRTTAACDRSGSPSNYIQTRNLIQQAENDPGSRAVFNIRLPIDGKGQE
jgi:hypothetical protein